MGKSRNKGGRSETAMAIDEPSWIVPASTTDMDTTAGNTPAEHEARLPVPGGPKQRLQRGRSSRNQKQRRALKLDKALAVADKKVTKSSKKLQLKDKKLSSKTLWKSQKRR